eukprot:1159008-Pelagomonas_calceolata.AAC.7
MEQVWRQLEGPSVSLASFLRQGNLSLVRTAFVWLAVLLFPFIRDWAVKLKAAPLAIQGLPVASSQKSAHGAVAADS